jgi:sec-independent protein translocase protein TatB
LQKLRGMSPRAALTKHLLDGDDSFLTGNFDKSTKPVSPDGPKPAAPPAPPSPPAEPGVTKFDSDAT